MYKLILSLLLLFYSSVFYGQHFRWEGNIIDKNTQKPVENVHVIVKNKEKEFFFISNSKGFVSIFYPYSSLKDSIIVSHLSYAKIVLNPKQLSNKKQIELEDKSLLLNDITINYKKKKLLITGTELPMLFGGTSLSWGQKQVVYFSADMYESGKLKKIEFAFASNAFSEKGDSIGCRMPVLLKIYARDTIANIPGEELLKDTVIIERQKGDKRRKILDISQYNITLPDSGIYCGFEAFPVEWYVQHGFFSLENLTYKTKSNVPGGYIFHDPVMGVAGNRKKIFQNYVLGGFAKEWKNVTEMFGDTLFIRLHIERD
jgi:hypothetical protein